MVKEIEKSSTSSNQELVKDKKLILLNDEVNTFEHVIESLIDVCGHSEEQAEQCAMVAHLKGKCAVRKGVYDDLQRMKEMLSDKKLSSIISD